ncbi:MAG: glycosyltransferase [Candidatus Tectomicrobia bacterium]|nr:glycosyltransferase [Candidatus Tectomicrobia bacterium]
MYNVGVVLSRGEIVIFCDSDAMVQPTFVETVIRAFERDPDIVLHMDEVRNNDHRFHPFNYPSFEEVVGPEAINWTGSTTTGLVDRTDPLHSRNYGACMGARREDLIAIGGADEHIDYLGHICGPYEMTFRLVNAGKQEVWHPTEFLYHVWHPGQAGDKNYLGPHDGRHMSTTALEARRSGRILPLVENPAIQATRLRQDEIHYTSFLTQVIPEAELEAWAVSKLGKSPKGAMISQDILRHPLVIFLLAKTSMKILMKQAFFKTTQLSRRASSSREMLRKIFNAYRFVKSVLQHNLYVIQQSRQCLKELAEQEIMEVAVYGATDIAEVLYTLTSAYPVKITGVYDDFRSGRFLGFNILPLEGLQSHIGKVIIASLFELEENLSKLQKLGIEKQRILLLQ